MCAIREWSIIKSGEVVKDTQLSCTHWVIKVACKFSLYANGALGREIK